MVGQSISLENSKAECGGVGTARVGCVVLKLSDFSFARHHRRYGMMEEILKAECGLQWQGMRRTIYK